jgi:hypothetical protein
LDDIAVFRSLKNKALEATRLDCVKGEVLPAFDEEEGPSIYSALLHERDRLMGLVSRFSLNSKQPSLLCKGFDRS